MAELETRFEPACRPRLVLGRWKHSASAGRLQKQEGGVLHFVYGARQIREGNSFEEPGRDLQAEAHAAERLDALGLERRGMSPVRTFADDATARWVDFLAETADQLRADGWAVECAPGWGIVWEEPEGWHGEWKPHPKGGFELALRATVAGAILDAGALVRGILGSGQTDSVLSRLDEGRAAVVKLDGGVSRFPHETLRPALSGLAFVVDRGRTRTRVPPLLAASLFDLDVPDATWTGLERLEALRATLEGSRRLEPVDPPATVRATLRPYQREGLAWLQWLRRNGFGGILADDMGLGKTLQTLAHLAIEHPPGAPRDPSLIVCPTSLLANWKAEASRFVPHLRTSVLHGPDRAARRHDAERSDLVLTTYPLLPRDEAWFAERRWHVVAMDEAQALKNSRALARGSLARIHATQRLALTGTPMENHLGEVWSLMDLLQPGLLGSEARFSAHVRQPLERTGSRALRDRLAGILAPFLLRRTKEQVARDLPGKTEIVQFVEFEDDQRELYETVRAAQQGALRAIIERDGWESSGLAVLEALMRVRQVCCDPGLLPPGMGGAGTSSAKLDWIREFLPEMVEEGRRVLVFSQFTSFLDLVGAFLEEACIPFLRLDGSTPDRGALVERFQEGRIPVFLLSLKAGGAGLNLTRADTVVFLDPWWNPAAERQAADRAHRIGQTQPVFVYRLVARDTIEERILDLQERKSRLAGALLEGGSMGSPRLTRGELDALLAPGA